MRFAAIADVHGNLPALDAVLADLARRGIAHIVNLGDLLSGPLWPAETAARLEPLNLPTVAGNHERQLLTLSPEQMGPSDAYTFPRLSGAQLAWLATLPPARAAHGAWLCHGTPTSDLTYFLHQVERPAAPGWIEQQARTVAAEFRLILCGHTHVPGEARLADGRLIINPGSVGLPAYSDDQPYPHAMESGTPDACYAILTPQSGDWQAEFVQVPYDHSAAARQAAVNGRPDWAFALQTGQALR
ncbi:MAG: metallophosphatase family protein [Bryobacteraceae bacterium]|nr:metallophosphatase family protein [Bryobacteraceae bacterium]